MTLTLAPASSALILVDIQNGTLSMPLAPYDRNHLVDAASRLGAAFAQARAPIFPVRIAFAADGGDRLTQPIDTPMMLPSGGFPANWSDLHPEIAALPSAAAITKHQWSAFYGTELDLQLRRRRIDSVVIAGIATNFGVESTARDAWQLGYSAIVAEDACTSVGEGLHAFAISHMLPRVSRVRAVSDIVAALGAQGAASRRSEDISFKPVPA